MNKNRLILSIIGGAIGLGVLVMLYMVWSSYCAMTAAEEGDSESEERVTGLNEVVERANRLSRGKIYPCEESVKAVGGNVEMLTDWRKEALKLAARGDRAFTKTTPPSFKNFIVADAKRLSALPGLVDGALVKPGFAFGPFKDYIAEGKMPSEAQLAELQRRWDDVTVVTETLAASGVAQLLDVQFRQQNTEEEEPTNAQQKKKKAKKPARQAESSDPGPSAYSYVFTFTTRPSGFAKVVNALSTSERFIMVDGFTFVREEDPIASALGGGEKKSADAPAARGRRGRRAAAVVESKPEGEEGGKLKNGIITDPVQDPPLKVTMTLTVYDFRTLEDQGKDEEVKK